MPLLLTTPHTEPAKHGQPAKNYAMVMLETFTVKAPARTIILRLQYGNVLNGKWVSDLEPFGLRIHNTPAVMQTGQDPETGEWVEVEVTPADLQFDQMVAAFVIRTSDTSKLGYNVVAAFLYQWLIDNGYYEGTIV